jgi:hypothetical protein
MYVVQFDNLFCKAVDWSWTGVPTNEFEGSQRKLEGNSHHGRFPPDQFWSFPITGDIWTENRRHLDQKSPIEMNFGRL